MQIVFNLHKDSLMIVWMISAEQEPAIRLSMGNWKGDCVRLKCDKLGFMGVDFHGHGHGIDFQSI